MVVVLGLRRQEEEHEMQKSDTEARNEMLSYKSELKKQQGIAIAEQSLRGIIDVAHDKVTIVPNALKSLNMNIGNAPKSFTLSGFCETAPKSKSGENLQTIAAYNFLSGELTINHVCLLYTSRCVLETA